MRRVLVEREFALPVGRLFACLAEHEHLGPLFGTRVERLCDGADGERNGVGSARRLSYAGRLSFEETVTEFAPGERIAYRITKGSPLRDHLGTMDFAARGPGRSHLRYEIVFGSVVPGVDRLVALSLSRSVPRGLARVEGLAG